MPEIICPDGCGIASLPPVLFDKCAPTWKKSEIVGIAMASADAAPFTLVTDPAAWATRLSQSSTTADSIRLLTVRGNIPAPTEETQTLTRNRTIVTNRKRILNFMIDEVNATNYDFVRTLECGALTYKIWIITDDGKELLGGNEGITAIARASMVYDEGTGAIQRAQGTFEWDSLIGPESTVNPIAGF